MIVIGRDRRRIRVVGCGLGEKTCPDDKDTILRQHPGDLVHRDIEQIDVVERRPGHHRFEAGVRPRDELRDGVGEGEGMRLEGGQRIEPGQSLRREITQIRRRSQRADADVEDAPRRVNRQELAKQEGLAVPIDGKIGGAAKPISRQGGIG